MTCKCKEELVNCHVLFQRSFFVFFRNRSVIFNYVLKDCVKICEFLALPPSILCHCAIVPSLVPLSRWYLVCLKLFLLVFSASKHFSRGYFVGQRGFIVGIRWSEIFCGGYFVGWKAFSHVYFVCLNFFPVGISWVQIFPREYFVGIFCP